MSSYSCTLKSKMVCIPTAFVGISSFLVQAQGTSHVHRPRPATPPPYALCSMAPAHQPSKAIASKLYPASIVPIILQNYLLTRRDLTLCPRGAAVGSIAQTISILLAVPLVAATKTATEGKVPFIAVDWLHGIEQLLMALPSHVMAMSFRQAALSHEDGKPLPVSHITSSPLFETAPTCRYMSCTLIFIIFSHQPTRRVQKDMVQC